MVVQIGTIRFKNLEKQILKKSKVKNNKSLDENR